MLYFAARTTYLERRFLHFNYLETAPVKHLARYLELVAVSLSKYGRQLFGQRHALFNGSTRERKTDELSIGVVE